MEQRLGALFSSVENALDSSVYSYSDSEYLVKKYLVEFLSEQDAIVASARKIDSAEEVVETVLNKVISTNFKVEDPADWFRIATSHVVDFAYLAYKNEASPAALGYATLLPEGHPRSYRLFAQSDSEQRKSLADWMSSDSRLTSDKARDLVYAMYSTDEFEDMEAEFTNLKMEALVSSGQIPEDLLPLVAAFNMSRAKRSAMAKALAAIRRRDRKGRFAEEFGRLKGWFSGKDGLFSDTGRIVGAGKGANDYQVEFKGSNKIPDGIYNMDASLSENVEAYLPEEAVKGLKSQKEVVSPKDAKYAVPLDQFMATRQDAPDGWTKNEDGSYSSGDYNVASKPTEDLAESRDNSDEQDDLIISGTGPSDSLDTTEESSFLVSKNGQPIGIAQDWAGVQEIKILDGGEMDSPEAPPEAKDVADITDESAKDMSRADLAEAMSKLSEQDLADGYGFWDDRSAAEKNNSDISSYEAGENEDGQQIILSRYKDGWSVTAYWGRGDDLRDKELHHTNDMLEAFDLAAIEARRDFSWDSLAERKADREDSDVSFDQATPANPANVVYLQLDRSILSPGLQKKHKEDLDEIDQAIFENDFAKIERLIAWHAQDRDLNDNVWSVIADAQDARLQRSYFVDNAIDFANKDELEDMLDSGQFVGWEDRIQAAIDLYDGDASYDQEIEKTLSPAQLEPASPKQYQYLQELLDERALDDATAQGFADAIKHKNLNKAQAGALINAARGSDFKDGVDPTKPTPRMLDSLQGYLETKDLTPEDVSGILDSLESDGSRDNVEALLNKLRRKKDREIELNQNISKLTKHGDEYQWDDDYNYVNVYKVNDKWAVAYSTPDLQDDGHINNDYNSFDSEESALGFANGLIAENENDNGYGRAADDIASYGDFWRQDATGTLADPATDKQWGFLESLVNGKKIDDPELERAVRSALEDRNLTKGEIGAFIGALRGKEDRTDVRRAATPTQVASIRRGIIERGLSEEEANDILSKLDGISFDDASEIISDLKGRDITDEGMKNLLDQIVAEKDVDTLNRIATKPEYEKWSDDIAAAYEKIGGNGGEASFNQDAPTSSRDIANFLAGLSADDKEELQRNIDRFDEPNSFLELKGMAVQNILDLAGFQKENANRINLETLAEKLDAEILDEFGPVEAARIFDGNNEVDLFDVSYKLDNEVDNFYSDNSAHIEEILGDSGVYGDGGATGLVNDDGSVLVELPDSASQTFDGPDRDQNIRDASVVIADYNSENMPASFRDFMDDNGFNMDVQARDLDPKDSAAALEFANRIDALAKDLKERNGDSALVRELTDYADGIRALAGRKSSSSYDELSSEVAEADSWADLKSGDYESPSGRIKLTVSEEDTGLVAEVTVDGEFLGSISADNLVDELDTLIIQHYGETDLPGAYSEYARTQFEELFNNGNMENGSYKSFDGRVQVELDSDVDGDYYNVFVDGEKVGSGKPDGPEGTARDVADILAEHFSKKA